jgi:hypothetical protein
MPTPSPAAVLPGEPRGFSRLWRTVKQIFHEVVGAMFAILAFGWLNSAFRAWTRDVAYWLIAMAVAVAGLFVLFAVSSFRRSRQL